MTSSNEWVSTSAPYITPRASGGDAWAEEAASHQAKGTQKLAHAGEVDAPPAVAAAFGLDEEAPVVTRRRVIYLDDEPVELADTYYPRRIAEGTPLAEPHKIKGGAVTLLAELGHVAAKVIEDVGARLPTEAERSQLQIDAGEPVVTLQRLTFDDDDQLFQVDLMIAPASRRHLRYELKVN
ncbi:UTRA domain-containing protein [Streptomyces sp. NPDC054933]